MGEFRVNVRVLSSRMRRTPRMVSVEKMRVCLRCGEEFLSQSSANRICPQCKGVGYGVYAEPRRLERVESKRLRVGDAVSLLGKAS